MDINEIPKYAIDTKNEFSKTRTEATNFPLKLFPYDAFDEQNDTLGFSSKEGFISTVLQNTIGTPQYDISLRPSVIVETTDFSVNARWIKNITNYNQREEDITSLIYSQERPVYQIDTELDLRDKLIFWTQESIYGDIGEEDIQLLIEKDIPVFEVDSYDPQYDENGIFQYATLILKRIVSFKAKLDNNDSSGNYQYIEFNFYRADVQPQNARRVRITYKSKPINWLYEIKDGAETIIDWQKTPNTKGFPLISPFLPRKLGGTTLNFAPSWVNEIGYWNANYEIWNVNQKGGFIPNTERTIYADEDGQLKGNVPTAETTYIEGAIPFRNYKETLFEFSLLSGFQTQREDLFRVTSQALDFSSPFNFMGYKVKTSISQFDAFSLTRPENNSNAVWETWEDQSLFYGDSATNGYSVVGIDSTYQTTIGFAFENNKVIDDELIYPEQYFINVINVLKGNATIYGEVVTERPPAIYDGDFDFKPNPKSWDLNELKQYTGIFYLDDEQSVISLRNGNSTELELPNVLTNDLPPTTSERIVVGNILNTYFELVYGSSINVKQRLCGRNWYRNYNENWVDEIEFGSNAEVITTMTMLYTGGYEYEMEWFQNTYEDSLINGDIPCEFSFLEGQTFKLPPLTYRASNRRGNPLSYGETKIWGTGTTQSKNKNILRKSNKIAVENNEKTLINIHTGEKIKNQQYTKGGKNGK